MNHRSQKHTLSLTTLIILTIVLHLNISRADVDLTPRIGDPFTGHERFPDYVVSLIYDDGPDAYSIHLAQYLRQQRIVATFNVVADWGNLGTTGYTVPAYSGYLSQVTALGHRLGNHSMNHEILDDCPDCCHIPGNPSATAAECIHYQLDANFNNICPYVSNRIFTFTPPGGHWTQFSKDSISADPALNSLLMGPYTQIPFPATADCLIYDGTCVQANAGDWQYAQLGQPPKKFAKDFIAGANAIKHGLLFMHDRNQSAAGTDYALRATQIIVPSLKQMGYVFVAPDLRFSEVVSYNNFTNPAWMASETYFGTFRSADINGDGLSDICARGGAGLWCSLAQLSPSTGAGSSPALYYGSLQLWDTHTSDASGYNDARYSSTLMLADVTGDGKSDLIIRGPSGLMVSPSTGTSFSGWSNWSYMLENGIKDFQDSPEWAHWNSPSSYKTFRAADINGDRKADVCARRPDGIVCTTSTGTSFNQAVTLIQNEFTNAGGWTDVRYAATIQLADATGDGRADIVGRNNAGLLVATAISSGVGFNIPTQWASLNTNNVLNYSDSEGGWTMDASNYETFRMADINGDGKADICGRSRSGMICAFSNGLKFTQAINLESRQFTDELGWRANNAVTLMMSDVNNDGRADLIARNNAGIIATYAP